MPPLISSPVAYPPFSSPHWLSPRKRRKLETEKHREPLQPSTDDGNAPGKSLAGFLLEDDSDDEGVPGRKNSNSRNQQNTSADQTENETGVQEASLALGQEYGKEGQKEIDSRLSTEGHTLGQFTSLQFTSHGQQDNQTALQARSTTDNPFSIPRRPQQKATPYSSLIASRSTTTVSGASTSYYGIPIHAIIESARSKQHALPTPTDPAVLPSIEAAPTNGSTTAATKSTRTHLWTEKYRARKFTDLIGDERTHRSVLRWLKAWDPIVFPSNSRRCRPPTLKHSTSSSFSTQSTDAASEKPHRKLLLLAGPPGLGKTTLAHVCARQAGYEVKEINASDERSRDVVRNRIRDMVGTENVRPTGKGDAISGKSAKPVCIVVDEVDGVTSGSGAAGGEGGFVKALLDLLALDARNLSKSTNVPSTAGMGKAKKKGDPFRLLRPIILICNDPYHPSLRLLRSSSHTLLNPAEIIHIRAPSLSLMIPRLHAIFSREGIPADADSVRMLCESTWNIASHKERRNGSTSTNAAGEGDIRGILVVAEWVARKFRNSVLTAGSSNATPEARLTRKWLEAHILQDLAQDGGAVRGLCRGGAREAAERVFLHNAGFPLPPPPSNTTSTNATTHASLQNAEASTGKATTHTRLLNLLSSSDVSETAKILQEVFTAYPAHPYSDDTMLSKPCVAAEWFDFHDRMSGAVHSAQAWELAPYLGWPVLGCHALFASQKSSNLRRQSGSGSGYSRGNVAVDGEKEGKVESQHPLHTPNAPRIAADHLKSNSATLTDFHRTLSLPLQRSFRGTEELVTDLIPFLLRMLHPDVKPVIVGGSEKGVASVRRGEERVRVRRAVEDMVACGVSFEKARVCDDDFDDTGEGGARAVAKPWQPQASVYRMTPPLDELGAFGTLVQDTGAATTTSNPKVRYALRQVLAQEHEREVKRLGEVARSRRAGLVPNPSSLLLQGFEDAGPAPGDAVAEGGLGIQEKKKENQKEKALKRDFFGRPIPALKHEVSSLAASEAEGEGGEVVGVQKRKKSLGKNGLPEGVKAITMKDLLEAY